jgi:hypothetical protein
MSNLEQIGTVTTRSGGLIVVDTGYLGIWSHDRPPVLPDGSLSTDEDTRRANSFVDLRIIGSDAERAGQMLDMSWNPFLVYDQPPEYAELDEKLQELVRKYSLDARFEVVSPRIPHRERVDLALKYGAGAGEIQFHGIWAAVVEGVPIGKSLPVLGERMPPPEHHNWKRVLVQCKTQSSIGRSEKVGHVGVDYARLLIGDFDALGAWHHEDSLDGLADYVFWGRDAQKVADSLDAQHVVPNEFGWTNLPEALAKERGVAVEDYKQKNNLKCATDYRPHSHHWQVMRDTRSSPTESGMTEVSGVKVCNFMTTWGDGIFEVHRDLCNSGELMQIRIEFDGA